MIIIPIKENENVDKALKRFKKKLEKTGLIRALRERQSYTKPSIRKRSAVLKAIYRTKLQGEQL